MVIKPCHEIVLSFDPGLSGAYSRFENGKYVYCEAMPIYKKIIKEKLLQFDLENGKKQVIKSGPNKGNFKMKVRRPEKTKNVLAVSTILDAMKEADIIVIEEQSPRPGNSAGSSFTTGVNYGKLLACAELSEAKIVTTLPRVWKRDMKLSQDKLESIEMAEKLTGKEFRTARGRLLHDHAESCLIGYWYLTRCKW